MIVFNVPIFVLIDLDATHSFVNLSFTKKLGVLQECLDRWFSVSTLLGIILDSSC